MKFDVINNSENLELKEYEVDSTMKRKYITTNSLAKTHVNMKLKDIDVSNVQDSFRIEYARYLRFKKHPDNSTNLNEITVEK